MYEITDLLARRYNLLFLALEVTANALFLRAAKSF